MTNEELAKLAKLLMKWMKWHMFDYPSKTCKFYDVCKLLINKNQTPVSASLVSDASDIPF